MNEYMLTSWLRPGLALMMCVFAVGLFAAQAQATEADNADRLYVANQGEASVAVVDMDTHEVVETVDLQAHGYSENAQPHHAIAEPDGSAWCVSLIGDNVVLKFDADNDLVGEVSQEAPGLMGLHPERDELYVARSMSAADPPQRLAAIERSEMEVIDEIDIFFPRPHAIAVSPDGRFAFSASLATNQFIGVDTEARRGELSLMDGPTHVINQMDVAPGGDVVAGTGQISGQLLFFDVADSGELRVADTVDVGAQPWHPVFDPSGDYVYVPNKQSNTVSVVDATTREVVDTIEDDTFAEPHGAAVSPDGAYLYISNNHQRTMMQQMAQDMMDGAEMPEPDMMDSDHDEHHEDHHEDEHHEDDHHEDDHHEDEHHEDDHHEDEHHEGHDMEDHPGTISVVDLETREVVKEIEVGIYATGIGTRAQ